MRFYLAAVLILLLTTQHVTIAEEDLEEGAKVDVGSQIGVDTRGDGVRVRIGPIRIRVGTDNEASKENEQTIGRFLSDQELMEAPVYSEKGRPLGHVEDFIVDTQSGDIPYIAIGFPDSFKGEKLFAIPIGSMELDRHEGKLLWRVDVTRDKLEAAPGFPRDKWPKIANRRWAKQIDIYYGVVVKEGDFATDFGTDKKALEDSIPLERASRLIGIGVVGINDHPLGKVERLIFDRETGKARYIAVGMPRTSQSTNGEANHLPVPMTAATFVAARDGSAFVLPISAERLQMVPRIDLEDALQSRQTDWAADVDTFFEKELPKAARADENKP